MPVKQDNPLWNFWPRNRVRLSWLAACALLLWVALARPVPLSLVSPSGFLAGCLMLGGILLRAWAAGVVHKDQQLATRGPYALGRHPLYIGSFLAVCGLSLMLGGWLLMVLAAILFGVLYLPTARNEERVLASEFPEQWQVYCRRTAMLYPRAMPQLANAQWNVVQWRYNREYQMPAMTVIAITAMQTARFWSI